MAMGKRIEFSQNLLFVPAANIHRTAGHPFYKKLNEILAQNDFDAFVDALCAKFYHEWNGRPSLAPGVYFRCMLIGYFEGIDSERGMAWRLADSLALRSFTGIEMDKATPDHSTISRTRRKIDLETHQEVFTWVLKILAQHDLIDGKTLGIDSTQLEANAAMKSIVRKDTKQNYQEFLADLAKASGIETPTREDLAKIDKKRKNKASNDDWESPSDPDAKIAKMKDGTTHLAHKAEHAVDLGENGHGAILAVNLTPADQGDTQTLVDTIVAASENLRAIADDPKTAGMIAEDFSAEVVNDKGYHSNDTMVDTAEMGIRTYTPEPDRGRRNWQDEKDPERAERLKAAQSAVYANRRRTRGKRGKELLKRRGEYVERSFAHMYETGGMRRLYLRGNENIHKRLLIHAGGFDLGLLMRKLIGRGTPRGFQGRFSLFFELFLIQARLWAACRVHVTLAARRTVQTMIPNVLNQTMCVAA